MAVVVIDTIKPKNNGTFPVVEAPDVKVTNTKRLDAALNEKASQADVTALQTAVDGKASQADLTALSETVSGKASQSDLNALSTTVAGKQNALTETQLTAVNSGITSALVTQIGTNTTAIAGKANTSDVTTATANLQSQIDAIVTPVTQDAEVENARVGADGTSYVSLKARLDAEMNENTNNAEWSESRINEINAIVSSKNLFNVATFTRDAERNQSTGAIISNANHFGVSDLIPVISGKTVYSSKNGTALTTTFIYLFYKDGSYKGVVQLLNNYTIPSDVGYVSVCILNDDAARYQLEYDAVTSYASYSNIDNSVNSLSTSVANMGTDISNINSIVYSKNLFNVATFTQDSERDHSTGEIIPNGIGFGVSDLIPVISGKTVYSSYDSVAFTTTYIYTFYKNGTFKGVEQLLNNYTVANDVGYISVCILNEKAAKYQIEYDSVTTYVPYGVAINTTVDKLNYYITNACSVNPLDVIKETPGFVGAFLKVGCIGDSLASGLSTAYKPNDEHQYNPDFYQHSWGQYLARATGNTYYNFSIGGLTTRSWLASEFATRCFDGDHNCTAYIIGLGQNDYNKSIPLGTISDINDEDYTQNPDTFYGNYGKIIQKIKEMFPLTKPKIFVITDPWQSVENAGYNTAIRAIAEHFANVWLIDMYQYGRTILNKNFLVSWKRDGHWNAMGYQYFAWMIATYIDWIIRNNYQHFKDVELIDTEYYYHTAEDQ